MPTHLPTGPTTGAPDPAGDWQTFSAALTDEAPLLSDRDDLHVICQPGAGRGHPGCFLPSLATIEIDGSLLGDVDPATADTSLPSDRDRYPALWGVFVHENAHAAHTHWDPPPAAPTAAVDAALTLEESRIEAAHLARRPADRRWLRAATQTIILREFTPDPHPAAAPHPGGTPDPAATAAVTAHPGGAGHPVGPPGPAGTPTPTTPARRVPGAASDPATPAPPPVGMSGWEAGQAAGLLLARVDAGTLEEDETAALAGVVDGVLGADRLAALRRIWQDAHACGDDDGETMLDLGRRWCEVLDIPADAPTPTLTGTAGQPPSPLAQTISSTLAAVHAHAAPEPGDDATDITRAARSAAAQTAAQVFPGLSAAGAPGGGTTTLAGERPPTGGEQTAARRLSRALRAAAVRERVDTVTTSPAPPGRLRMRAALARDAQRAAGAIPTAEPFVRTVRRHTPSPPLRLGIACDVSGSMEDFTGPVASAAWICARAAGSLPDATTATVLFGADVLPLTWPGRSPATVTEFEATDCAHQIARAVDALDHTLDLSRPGAARLLAVISDGYFTEEEWEPGQERITRLVTAGCAVIWISPPGEEIRSMTGAVPVILTDPAATTGAIARAATRALATTR